MLEGLAHGRKEALKGRAVPDIIGDRETYESFGSGGTEYYNSREALFGKDVAEYNFEQGKELFEKFNTFKTNNKNIRSSESKEEQKDRIKQQIQQYEVKNSGVLDRVSNTLKGFASTFVSELVVNPLDAVGDLTGLFDFGTEEEKADYMQNFSGYNSLFVQESMDEIGKQWEVITDKDATDLQKLKAVGSGILEAFLTPEMLGTSLGALLSWVTPGAALKGFGLGAKFVNQSAKIDRLRDVGNLTKTQARALKIRRLQSVDGVKDLLINQSGYLTAALGNVNNQYEEFVENNNGVELEGAEKAKWFAGRLGIQVVNQNIDKIVDVNIIKSPAFLSTIVPAVKGMTNKEFANVAKTMGVGVAKTVTNAGMEAAQEYSQTMMEVFNSRFGSEQFSDVDTFTSFITDERNVTEAGIAAIAGAGGSGQFEVLGSALPLTKDVAKGVGSVVKNLKDKTTGKKIEQQNTPINPVEDIKTDPEITPEVAKVAEDKVAEEAGNTVFKYVSMLDKSEGKKILSETDGSEEIELPKLRDSIKGEITSYDEELASLEKAEVFYSSDKNKNEDNLKVIKRSKKEILNIILDDESPVLGSRLESEDIVAEFLNVTDVEDGKLILTEEETTSLNKFVKDNDITPNRFNIMQVNRIAGKDAFTVREESITKGSRSSSAYRDTLKTLVNTANPDKNLLTKTIDQVNFFLNSQEVRKASYDSTLNAVKQNVEEFNKKLKSGKLKEVEIKGLKVPLLKRTYVKGLDKAFIETELNNDGTIKVKDNSQAISDSIQDTISHLRKTKKLYGKSVDSILDVKEEIPENTIYIKNKASNKVSRERDQKFVKNKNITKVIVDKDNHSAKWSDNGDYVKDNEDSVFLSNTSTEKTYSSEDTVLIATTGSEIKKGSFLSRQLQKASKNGAFVVVENTKMKMQMGRYQLVEVKVDGVKKFINKSLAAPYLEKEAVAVKEKETTVKTRKSLINMFSFFESKGFKPSLSSIEEAYSQGKITEARYKTYKKQEQEILKLFPDTSKEENGKSSNQKIEERYKNQKAKTVETEVSKLLKVAVEGEGTDSSAFSEAINDVKNSKVISAFIKKSIMEKFDSEYALLEKGEETISGWKEASLENKKTAGYLNKWLKENVKNPKSIIKAALDSSIGKGKKTIIGIYNKLTNEFDIKNDPYQKKNAKGEFVYDRETNPFIAKDKEGNQVSYQVYETDPSTYIQVNKTTVLNSIPVDEMTVKGAAKFNNLIKESIKLLSSAIRSPDLRFNGMENTDSGITDLANSPAGAFIFNKDKEADPNIAVALNVALHNFIKNNAYLMTKGKKSKKDLAQILGIDENSITKEAVEMMQDKGLLYKTASNSIGKDVAALLGISRKSSKDVDAQAYDALLADLGQTALTMGVESGLLTRDNSMLATTFATKVLGKKIDRNVENKAKVIFVQVAKNSEDDVENMVEVADLIAEILPDSDYSRVEPLFQKPTEDQKNDALKGMRNEKLGAGINEETKQAAKRLMDAEWVADIESINEVLENKETIKFVLGFVNIDEKDEAYKNLSKEGKDVQESLNREIEKSFEELKLLMDQNADQKEISMWFKYFISKNGRFFIDSNTIQPQNDKQLSRFLFSLKSHINTFDYEKKPRGKHEFKVKGNDVTFNVHYALAQAFGFKTDKKDPEKISAFSEKVLFKINTLDKIKAYKKEFMEKGEVTIDVGTKAKPETITLEKEHFAHAMQAFKFLSNLQKRKGSFDSSISAEFDAITNGFGIKLLQMPIVGKGLAGVSNAVNSLSDWLVKVGFVKNDNPIIKSVKATMNYVLDSGGVRDSYQTLGAEMADFSFKSMLEDTETKKYSKINDSKYMKNVWEALTDPQVLPVAAEGKVDSALRNLLKYPFMTFNYASSIKSIRQNMVTGELVTKLVSDMSAADISDLDSPVVKLMQAIIGKNKTLKEFQESLRTEYFETIKGNDKINLTVNTLLREMIDSSYGAKVEEILNKEFEPFIRVQNDVNESFKAMFQVFNLSFLEEIKKASKNGVVTQEKEKEIYLSLKDKWPMIKGPLTRIEEELYSEGVPIYDTVTASGEVGIDRRKAVRANLANDSVQKEVRVSHMVKQLSEAVAAGSVLPVHFIDGATMSKTVNGMPEGKDLLTIHDAIIPSLIDMGLAQETYNKSLVEVNSNFSFVEEIMLTMDRFMTTVDSNKEIYKDKKIEVFIDDKKEVVSVQDYVRITRNNMAVTANKVKEGRNNLFKELNKGYKVMHMVGTSDGVYEIEENSIDVAYTDNHKINRSYSDTSSEKLSTLKEEVNKLNKKAPNTKC
jgi:hypothetical protein